MNLKNLRNGAMGLVMLASSALPFSPSMRQTEVSAGCSYDTSSSGYMQLHHQHDSSDIFLRIDKGSMDAYGNLNIRHPLGQGSAFYEFRDKQKDDDKEQTHLLELGHTLLDFKPVRNSLYYRYNSQTGETSEIWMDTIETQILFNYGDNEKDTRTKFREHSFKLENKLCGIFGLGLGYRNIKIKEDYTKQREKELEMKMIDTSFSSEDKTKNSSDYSAELNRLCASAAKRNMRLFLAFIDINGKSNESKSDTTGNIFGNPTITLYTNKIDLSGYITSLHLATAYSALKNLSIFTSYGKTQGKLRLHNSSWVPTDTEGKSRLEDIAGNVNLMLGKRFLNILDVDLTDHFYDVKADTGVLGLNPQGPHKDTRILRYSYDLFVPFSDWDVDRLVEALLFRNTEKRLDDQEDRVLGLAVPRRTHWLYTPLTRSNLHFAFEREESKPTDEQHETNRFEAGLKHCVMDIKGIKLSPFYNLITSSTTSSYEDTASTEPTHKSSTTNSFGLEGVIKNRAVIRITVTDDGQYWKTALDAQVYFTPYKQKWSGSN